VHVGLGSATEVADVRVKWADRSEELFRGPFAAGKVHQLRRGAGVR
jgi:hypothetical protein